MDPSESDVLVVNSPTKRRTFGSSASLDSDAQAQIQNLKLDFKWLGVVGGWLSVDGKLPKGSQGTTTTLVTTNSATLSKVSPSGSGEQKDLSAPAPTPNSKSKIDAPVPKSVPSFFGWLKKYFLRKDFH